ncbi:MAG: S9 family peptidase [Firmicutes bacterium]|nr:S9 family peptidase [Bacillota bacterium]
MKTRRGTVVDNYHGTLVSDPYRWLEEDTDLEVKAWVRDQHLLTERYLKSTGREEIKRRLRELWSYPRFSLPQKAGGLYYYQKNDGLQNQAVLYRQKGLKGRGEPVLDPNLWSSEGTQALGNFRADDSGKYLAYTVSAGGSDRREIRILDLESKKDLEEILKWCRFTNLAWLGKAGFYYSRYPRPGSVAPEDENNFCRVYWHKIGTPQEEDTLIFSCPEQKELSFSPSVSADERYLTLHVFWGTDSRNGFYYQDLEKGGPFVRLLEQGDAKFLFLGRDQQQFFFLTDWQAPRGRIIAINLDNPGREHWQEIIPEQEETISEARLINNRLVLSLLDQASSLLRTYTPGGKFLEEIPLPALGSVQGFSGRQNDTELFLAFTSFLEPTVSFCYDFTNKGLQAFGERKLNFNPEDYKVKQVFYPSKDGTKIPLFLIHKKGLELNGANPTLLYGYGGFNIALTPSFSPSRLLWLEKGGVFAIANLRGGSEFGEEWHRAGMLEQKQNVFDDFIAAGEWLQARGYTNPRRLAIKGRSNGGLLVSACMVQRPALFQAAVCAVPVTDMLRFHKFTVGHFWVPEYGNAEQSREHFQFLYKYSPLHNVKPAEYPGVLIVTAEGDDRVVPGHAYKFLAALQEAQEGPNPILLRVDSSAGHGHGKPTAKIIKEQADIYAFLFKALQME